MKTFKGNTKILDAVGLKERLAKLNLTPGAFINKKSNIRYIATWYDDKKDLVILLQDTGRLGGVGSKAVKPENLAKNFYKEIL